MNSILSTIFGLLGGLAVFIFGMNMMSEGLQKAAGARMKSILGLLTKNPVLGVLAGALTTAVLQSSSATTVMVIGFVSAGLMSLPQAISVILGANIGTTMTAQIISFKIDDFIWPIVFIGFVIFFFGKKEKVKNVGQSIFAFGLLFVGIITMGDVMKPLASSEIFIRAIERVSDIPVLGAILGTVMTLVIQSSSATIAVLQNFAEQPLADGVTSIIGLEGAIPILLGDNIGTTITALLACVGQSKNAKRTAVAHSVFNITGACVFIWIVPWFADFVRMISPQGAEVEVISRQIANAHTAFNMVNTIIWLPLIWLMVKIVKLIVPGEEETEGSDFSKSQLLDAKLTGQPVVALHMAGRELVHMGEIELELIRKLRGGFSKIDVNEIQESGRLLDGVRTLGDEIQNFISNLFTSGVLNESLAKKASALMYVGSDFSHMNDRCRELLEALKSKAEGRFLLSDEAVSELDESMELVEKMLKHSLESIRNDDKTMARSILFQRENVQNRTQKLRKRHVERVNKGKCSPEFTVAFTGVLNALERIGENCVSIAEVLSENDHIYVEVV